MKPSYCYWSVCDGAYRVLMEHCVRTARAAGVFKEFHVLTDQPIAGCECYDACECDKAHGLFKLHYLKVGMSRLNFEYFVWLDADSIFVRNPVNVLGLLGKSPIHVPLETNLSALSEDAMWKGVSMFRLREAMQEQGIMNQVYFSRSAFWIVHHDVIEQVYDLAFRFWHKAKETGLIVDVAAALGFAMQILCADPKAHLLTANPSAWASDDEGLRLESDSENAAWAWRQPFTQSTIEVCPAVIHVPHSRCLLQK